MSSSSKQGHRFGPVMPFVICLYLVFLILSSCRSVPDTVPQQQSSDSVPTSVRTGSPFRKVQGRFVAYDSLPGWHSAELMPGLSALKRSCALFSKKNSQDFVADHLPFSGTIGDWQPACAALEVVGDPASARSVIEALFTPVELVRSGNQNTVFTGYFEPVYEARHAPVPPFTEPVPARPNDLFVESGTVYQILPNGRRQPYPARADIVRKGVRALAYAHPADVFFLQIQGSGRLVFPDGRTMRAVYAGHNGQPFKSMARWLKEKQWITRGQMGMAGIRAWADRATPAQIRKAMNSNPRFVFFDLKPENDSALGPAGSLGVPLTPRGSIAVDPAYHAGGLPMFAHTSAPGLGGKWSGLVVAQDTGGAITGSGRVDLYFGTGFQAGAAADTLNAPGRLWLLLPHVLAARIKTVSQAETDVSAAKSR